MSTAPDPGTAGDQEVAAHTTMHVDRVRRLASRFPNDHKIRNGKILLTADAHAKLGNKDTVRALKTHGMDLATTWERFQFYFLDSAPSQTWTTWNVSTGNSNGIEHMKDVNFELSLRAPKNAEGVIHFRWVVWNRALQGALKDELDAIGEDYGLNRRDRYMLYNTPAENGLVFNLESRFNGLLLRPDDALALNWQAEGGSQGQGSVSILVTGHARQMDKGGF